MTEFDLEHNGLNIVVECTTEPTTSGDEVTGSCYSINRIWVEDDRAKRYLLGEDYYNENKEIIEDKINA